jgi:hypothetical protein
MDDADRLRNIEAIVAALRLNESTTRFLGDRRFFANLVEELAPLGNRFAARFQTFNTLSGKDCPDFAEGLSLGIYAGLLAHVMGAHPNYLIELPPRRALDVLAKLEGGEHYDVTALAKRYAVECRIS